LLAGCLLSINIPALAGNTVAGKDNSRSKAAPSSFVMPSRNIYCALTGEGDRSLRCEIRSSLNPLPRQPYRGYCEFDWGAGLLLPQAGKPEVLCISDTIASNSYTLAYGKTWRKNGFKCVSQRAGLTCTNASGNGFFLSRKRWQVF
jgi:hypothetical protein